MTHADAHNLLDQRRAGAEMPEIVVNKALELVGDYDPGYTVADAMLELVGAT